MTNNKKALIEEDNIKSTFIIPENINEQDILDNMPEILKDTTLLLKRMHINTSLNCILNVLLSKTAQMLTSKRIYLKEVENHIIPNWYAIVFMPSGSGKDRLTKDLDTLIFNKFHNWFATSAQNYKLNKENEINRIAQGKYPDSKDEKLRNAFINNEREKIRNIVIEMQDGTQEGFYSDAKTFANTDFGSLFLKISEFGLYLKSTNTEKEQFLNCLYNAYDGKVISKCIKGSQREPDIENLPLNVLLYSDYTLFKKDIKDIFNTLMMTGLNRRAVISFKADTDRKPTIFSYEDKRKFFDDAAKISDAMNNIFQTVDKKTCYILSKQTNDNILNQYIKYLNNIYNSTENQILKAEVLSREFKALKLSCIYACLNHPKNSIIDNNDLIQAIYTIQGLSGDLKTFIDYKPQKKDKYDAFYNFLKENIQNEYTKLQLIREFMKFGYSREKIRTNFDEIINILKEIASTDDFILIEQKINNNSGTKYYLRKKEEKNSNENIVSFEKLLANPVNLVKV